MNRILHKTLTKLRAFRRENAGQVAIITALSLPVLVLGAGGAMDYSRILAAKSKLQAATDAAILATYKHHSMNPDLSDAALKAYFRNQLQAGLQSKFETQLNVQNVRVVLNTPTHMTAQVEALFPTTFIRLAGIPEMTLNAEAEVKTSQSYTEVALVLDTTGSMSGSKIEELKTAAKSFIDHIYKQVAKEGTDNFRIAIVPFSQYVNIGENNRSASWADIPADTKTYYNRYSRWIRWQGCVGSRPYPYNVQDDGYALNKIPGVMEWARRGLYPENDYREYYWDDYYRGNFCPPPITPLKSVLNESDLLKEQIDNLVAGGWTYIPAGLMWGWRVLSPQAPFTEGLDDAEFRIRGGRRIIILMTDGANTKSPSSSIYKEHTDGVPYSNSRVAYSNDLTLEACNNIKATNPGTGQRNADIITITFDVEDETIKTLMRDCATLGSYDVDTGELLRLFENLAKEMVQLHLSK